MLKCKTLKVDLKRRAYVSVGSKMLVTSAFVLPTIFSSEILFAQTSSSNASPFPAMNRMGVDFLEKTGIPGLSVAFAQKGRIVHQEAFGYANRERKEKLTTTHSFRVASVSKPITAAIIFALIERGKLNVGDLVFGAQGILRQFASVPDTVRSLSLHHLLTHSAGGWGNRNNDPMFMHRTATHDELIPWTLQNLPLARLPGTGYEYSNFGYCLLGRVIEKVTGKSYVQAANDLLLNRAGITEMQLAGNTQDQRAKNEVWYYSERGEDPYSMNISRMDSHGGWLATPADIAKFASSVDGFRANGPNANILQRSTIDAMTKPSKTNPSYANGWEVNSAPNWWHFGTLPGTTSLVVRTASGMCWAASANARTKDSLALLDDTIWKMARSVTAWNA
jgi:CubicO group peptidase (beta-lactamase class C family)